MAGGEESNQEKVGAGASEPRADDAGDTKVANLQLEAVSRRVERIEAELRALRAQLSSLVARAS